MGSLHREMKCQGNEMLVGEGAQEGEREIEDMVSSEFFCTTQNIR